MGLKNWRGGLFLFAVFWLDGVWFDGLKLCDFLGERLGRS